MSDAFTYDVFLSHNQHDKPRVRELAERLREAGLRVWIDESMVKAGDIITLAVEEGLEQSRTLVLCLSERALASDWVKLERSTAIHRDPANTGRRFIPLLLADCDLPKSSRRYKYVDFREETGMAFKLQKGDHSASTGVRVRLRNGTLWDDPEVCKKLLSSNQAAQKTLINEVKRLHQDLDAKRILPKPLRRRLLILSVLIAYLEARKVFEDGFFARFKLDADKYFQVLADGPALVKLLEHLRLNFTFGPV